MSGGGTKGSSSQKQKTTIPDFLKPFMDQIIGTSSGAMQAAQDAAGQDQTADMNPTQLEGLERAIALANGQGGFLKQAQDTAMQTAQGGGADNVLPPELQKKLMEGGGTIDAGTGISDVARQTLEGTARGDFLFGGEGFDAAVAAAQRRAQPAIMSAFGNAGVGGADSGLAKTAIGTSAIDAFASQFANERNNMLGAANSLGGFDLQDQGQKINAQSSDLQRASAGQGLLAGINQNERQNQIAAADKLPGLGLLDADILQQAGGQLQDQAQREIEGGQDRQMQLLMAALSSVPQLASLFGSKGKSKTSQVGLGFG